MMLNHFHTNVELGGAQAEKVLRGNGSAIHATCYDGVSKAHVLKSVGAFWDFTHYKLERKTLRVPPIVYEDRETLMKAIHAYAWFAKITNRDLIVPNLRIEKKGKGVEEFDQKRPYFPWFRTVNVDVSQLPKGFDAIEPGYWFRMKQIFPTAEISSYKMKISNLETARKKIQAKSHILDLFVDFPPVHEIMKDVAKKDPDFVTQISKAINLCRNFGKRHGCYHVCM